MMMRSPISRLCVSRLCVAAIAGLFALVEPGPARAEDDVVTFTDGPANMGMLQVARAKGMCAKYHVKCEIVTTASTPLAVQALIGGTADVGAGSTDVMIQAIVKGSALTMLWGQWRFNPVFVAVNNAVGMPHIAQGYPAVMQDFKGKTVGVSARGASTEFQFVSMLQGAGMDRTDVTFVNVGGPPTALGALKSRQVDAIVSWQPAGLLCTTDKFCTIAIDTRQNQGPKDVTNMNGAVTVYAMRTAYLKDHGDLADRLLHAFTEADAWMHDPANFEAFVAMARPVVNFGDRPDADALLHAYLKLQLGIFGTTIERPAIQAAADYLYSTKQIGSHYDTAGLVWEKAPKP